MITLYKQMAWTLVTSGMQVPINIEARTQEEEEEERELDEL